MTGLVLLVCPRHLPAGVLSWPAWQLVHAGPVTVTDPDQEKALSAAGVDVRRATPTAALLAAGGTWVCGPDDAEGVRALAGPGLRELAAAPDVPGSRLLDVVAVMDRLRSPGGCPWDAAQTHASLAPYLLEECYELYQALEDDDRDGLREELGDVLLQVAFHARLGQEGEPAFSLDDVAGDLVDKLVRRHPHVFAGASADDLEGSWEALKAAEKGRTSVTDGVPLALPALMLAAKLQKRGSRLGAPTGRYPGLGGELWHLVDRCRAEGVDPEVILRTVAREHRDRLARTEHDVRRTGGDPAALSPDEWSQRWG